MLYDIDDRAYLNLTNRCPAACRFCVKKDWDMRFGSAELRLEREPEVSEVLAALSERLKKGPVREVVFCGFGDCSYRLDAVREIGLYLRNHHPGVRVRLNTLGLANLIWGRDVVRLLALSLDEVSVSLNTADAAQWEELHRPSASFRGQGFSAVCVFIARCIEVGLKTTVTAIDQPGVDLDAVRALARRLGAGFRLRPRLN